MGRHVTALVYVSHPETGVAHVLNVGDEVPEWAEITNPDVLGAAPVAASAPEVQDEEPVEAEATPSKPVRRRSTAKS